MNFKIFGSAIRKQFETMSATTLFRTDVEKDMLWLVYLESFPEGSNPIFKERTEHDCQVCKSFIRHLGGVVTIVDGKLVTIWDVELEGPYGVVAGEMSKLVKSGKITSHFFTTERKIGTEIQHSMEKDGPVTWNHYSVNIPTGLVKPGLKIGPLTSDLNGRRDSMINSLRGISQSAIETVVELIDQNSIYRGQENKFAVDEFLKLKKKTAKFSDEELELFCWEKVANTTIAVAKMRGTAIGTLLEDISEGKPLDIAVKSFESKTAPANYKRPTALVTKAMIEAAQKEIKDSGFEESLERRYATIADITINNIIFANREAKKAMNVFDDLISKVPEKVQSFDKVEEISIDKFIETVLPKATSLEVMFENGHVGNLVSLIAPVHSHAKSMFKWDNNFSWSYAGEVADSIKERVKSAGGNITGDFRASLSWYNYDDLDLHLQEPQGGQEIYFAKRLSPKSRGELDVDMNAGMGKTRTPVENIFYKQKSSMIEGEYKLFVENFSKRETKDEGFEVELEFMGKVYNFVYDKPVPDSKRIAVAVFEYSHKTGLTIKSSITSKQASKTVWNVATQTFQKVNVVMFSPNYWDGQHNVGNKHYFFMLENCRNEEKARGFFNEFLNEELNKHRKVLEVVGSKMKTEESNEQLSGIGFSSTQRNTLLCRVKGSFERTVKITF